MFQVENSVGGSESSGKRNVRRALSLLFGIGWRPVDYRIGSTVMEFGGKRVYKKIGGKPFCLEKPDRIPITCLCDTIWANYFSNVKLVEGFYEKVRRIHGVSYAESEELDSLPILRPIAVYGLQSTRQKWRCTNFR